MVPNGVGRLRRSGEALNIKEIEAYVARGVVVHDDACLLESESIRGTAIEEITTRGVSIEVEGEKEELKQRGRGVRRKNRSNGVEGESESERESERENEK